MDEKKKIVIEIAVAVVIIVAVVALVVYALRGPSGGTGSAGTQTQTQAPSVGIVAPVVPTSSKTVSSVPANTIVPNAGATGTPANVAVPVVQSVGSPSGNVSYRSFDIKIMGGAYAPSTVAVKQGDTVNLELTAVDSNYGFTQPQYGFNATILEGKTQTIQFQALQTGDFTFYCASCGGPSKGPIGHLIVTAD